MFFDPLIQILENYSKEIKKDGSMNYVCLSQNYLH